MMLYPQVEDSSIVHGPHYSNPGDDDASRHGWTESLLIRPRLEAELAVRVLDVEGLCHKVVCSRTVFCCRRTALFCSYA